MSDVAANSQRTPELPTTTGRSKRLLLFGIFIAAVLIGAIFAIAFRSVTEDKRKMEEDILNRQKTVTSSRAQATESWVQSLVEQVQRFAGADIIQMFAAEVDRLPGGVPLLFGDPSSTKSEAVEELSSQVPLTRIQLSEFVSYGGFYSATLVTSRGEAYISTEAVMKPLTEEQKTLIRAVVDSGEMAYAPASIQDKGLTLEMFVPIMPPQYQREGKRPVAVLIVSQLVDMKLAEMLSPGAVVEKGRALRLLQKNGEVFQNVVPGSVNLKTVPGIALEDGQLPFALRRSFSGTEEVYSSGTAVRTLNWWIVSEHDAAAINKALSDDAKKTYGMAGLLALALVLLFSAAWWRLVGQEQCAINDQIRELLVLIDNQKKLLDGINSTISDPISLTDGKGVYRYVNKAFAQAVGRDETDVVGLDAPAVFGFDTARRLNASDQHVLMTGESVSVSEVLWLQSKRFYFQISKTPLREPGTRTPQGIVSVFRDITQLVETEERSRRVVQQTIDALVRTIEEADPFLGGHSRIMGGIAVLMAKQLRLDEFDVATIEAAANLSQIGKMFVPREILLKPGALTAEEKREMERHVEYARNVLKGIEFDLPVVAAIYQMNERLDGRGYPKGLSGGEVSMHARVLAIANAFTAMAKPRSYRPALPVNEVVAILEKQKESYDQEVVAALRQVLATPAGERLVEQAAASKAI